MKTRLKQGTGHRTWAGLLALAIIMSPVILATSATPAEAAPRIKITSSFGTAKASATAPTNVTVTGSGLQSVPKAFGGIYVAFGYVKNSTKWRPSQGGISGKDFFYIADSQTKANQGYQRFVAFPGSSTADSANGGTISASGNFKLNMTIPGPTFSAETTSGGSIKIDCREVQCGIFTFGAHGVANGNNESFTPISFGSTAAAKPTSQVNTTEIATNDRPTQQSVSGATSQQPVQDMGGGTNQRPSAADEVPSVADPQPSGAAPQAVSSKNPTLGIEQKTVVAGRTLGFTGRGFAAGEQVVGTLAAGITAAGPITAGTFGEVAGVVQIPADMTPGTHKLKLAGAGSGISVEAEFSVMANPATFASTTDQSNDGIWWALVAVIIAASLLLFVILVSLVTALTRRNQGGRSAPHRRKKPRTAIRKRDTVIQRHKPQELPESDHFGASSAQQTSSSKDPFLEDSPTNGFGILPQAPAGHRL